MLLGLMEIMAMIFYWTWFIWPLVLLAALAEGGLLIVRDHRISGVHFFVAYLSLLFILSGVVWPSFAA